MDKFVEKISGLSYELFAILLPGIFAIVCSIVFVSFCQLLTTYSPSLGETLFSTEVKDHQFFAITIVLLAMYLLGQASTYFAKASYEAKTSESATRLRQLYEMFCEILWSPGSRQRPDNTYSHVDLDSVTEILRSYGMNIKEAKWNYIFGPASRLIFQLGRRSMVQTYQNKYTLHRTLAMQFSLLSKGIFFVSFMATIILLIQAISTAVNAYAALNIYLASAITFILFFLIMILIINKVLKVTIPTFSACIVGLASIAVLMIMVTYLENINHNVVVCGWVLSIALFFFQRYFSDSFRRFWTEFGSQVCWEIQALKASQTINEQKNNS